MLRNDGPQQGVLPARYIDVLIRARECGVDSIKLRKIGFLLCEPDYGLLAAFENWLARNE
jgi:hypothetical protein